MIESLSTETVHQALKEWQQGATPQGPFDNLLLFQQQLAKGSTSMRTATNQVLQNALDCLATENAEGCKILELRFAEGRAAHQVAVMLAMAEGTVWRKQSEAIQRLTEIIRVREEHAREERLSRFADRIETATYTHLLGRGAHLLSLEQQFMQPGPPWQIAIEGMGGIGKTSLAHMLSRRLLGNTRWQDFAWVSVRQAIFNGGGAIKEIDQPILTSEELIEELIRQLTGEEKDKAPLVYPQKVALLKELLHARPHLIVIDNLETLTDQEALMESLRWLANPTKFLLTTRYSHFHTAGLYHFAVPELTAKDSLALMRQEARLHNTPGVEEAEDDELMPIFAAVGGNPLALRLVVGQLHAQGLTRVLADLRDARGRKTTEMYAYVYRRAWQELDENARKVFLLMPLAVDGGGEFEYLVEMGALGGLSYGQISDGLDELVQRNLVDSRGDLQQRRYSIHGLTRTFLQQEVLGWQNGN
ncbi:MAG: hypothetical protein H6642_01795 [Caldilineaceae bacterium]|nr:hypothetical protein [Caldilineaceae bacterium]